MTTTPPAQSPHDRASFTTGYTSMSGDEGNEREWRTSIVGTLSELSKVTQNTALLVERLDGRMTATENTIKEMKAAPASQRDMFATVLQAGGCFGSVVFAAISLTSVIISLIVFFR